MCKRKSLKIVVARLIQRIPFRIFRFIELPFVHYFSRKNDIVPAIFLFALPRSGSTVTYQSICHGLSVNYLSNIWNLLYQLPFIGGEISSGFASRHKSNFKSQHGFVSGIDGPAEGLAFWSLWLGCGLSDSACNSVPYTKIEARAKYLRKVITALGRRDLPFVTAFLGHSLLPDRVEKAFSGSVLIRLHREPVANALSILKSLRQSQSSWFSIKPRECDGAEDESEYFVVASQVYWLNKRLDDAECNYKMLSVSYEALCDDPSKEMERIIDKCEEQGLTVKRKFQLPKKLNYKKADLSANDDAIKIKKELDKLEGQYGRLKRICS